MLVLVDSLLLLVDCALMLLSDLFSVTLQEKINTVTVEGVENVGEEDCIKIKTELHYIQLVRTVKCEQEVSVLCSV